MMQEHVGFKAAGKEANAMARKGEWRSSKIDGAGVMVEAAGLRGAQWRKEVSVMAGCAREPREGRQTRLGREVEGAVVEKRQGEGVNTVDN